MLICFIINLNMKINCNNIGIKALIKICVIKNYITVSGYM